VKVATNQQTIKEQAQEFMELNSDVIEKNPKSLARIEPEKNSETLNSIESNTKNKLKSQLQGLRIHHQSKMYCQGK